MSICFRNKVSDLDPTVSSSSLLELARAELPQFELSDTQLGAGASAKVFKAVERATQRAVAIKIVDKRQRMRNRERALEALMRESAIVSRLRHPHIVQIHSVVHTADAAFFIMELMRGGELFDKIVELGSYTERDAAECVRNITGALAYLHEHGVVHRDLKPENLLLRTPDSITDVCIADFGYARLLGGMTRANSVVGTADYVAPEVLLGGNLGYSDRCDEWSLGVITYCLLCGYPPFHGDSEIDTMDRVRSGAFDFPPEEWARISPVAINFIRQLLRVDPLVRMSAAEALEHEWLTRMVNVPAANLQSLHVGDELQFSQLMRRSSHFESPNVLSPRHEAALAAAAASATATSRRTSRGGLFLRTSGARVPSSGGGSESTSPHGSSTALPSVVSRKASMTSAGFLAAMELGAARFARPSSVTSSGFVAAMEAGAERARLNKKFQDLTLSGGSSGSILSAEPTPLRDSAIELSTSADGYSPAPIPGGVRRRSSSADSSGGFLPIATASPPSNGTPRDARFAVDLRRTSTSSSDDGGGFLPAVSSGSLPNVSAPSKLREAATLSPELDERLNSSGTLRASLVEAGVLAAAVEPPRSATPTELDEAFPEFADAPPKKGARRKVRKSRSSARVERARRGSSVERVAPLSKRDSLRRVSVSLHPQRGPS